MSNSKSNTLLVELIIVILFFALSQAIVLQVFAKAQQINRDTEALNRALVTAQDAAETLAVCDSAESALLALGFAPGEGGLYSAQGEGYTITAEISTQLLSTGTLTSVELAAYRDGAELFRLPAAHYRGGAGT